MGLQRRQADVSISIRCCSLDGRGKCVLLYLAKKLRSIFGHKDCEEGSIVRRGLVWLGGWSSSAYVYVCVCVRGDQWQALSH